MVSLSGVAKSGPIFELVAFLRWSLSEFPLYIAMAHCADISFRGMTCCSENATLGATLERQIELYNFSQLLAVTAS